MYFGYFLSLGVFLVLFCFGGILVKFYVSGVFWLFLKFHVYFGHFL